MKLLRRLLSHGAADAAFQKRSGASKFLGHAIDKKVGEGAAEIPKTRSVSEAGRRHLLLTKWRIRGPSHFQKK